MTDRLYLRDPYLTRFSARVVSLGDLGGRPAAVLDRSAFYPEGGGQPADRGTLAGAAVVDVQEKDGAVLHVLDRPLSPGEVEGVVDWQRRFDHMQQHHGQHLLSAAFERVLEAPTTSFHLGERTCTIDLDCSISRLDERALRSAEAAANETVWRDLPVVARDFAPEERSRLPLRKEPVKGDRVVLVEGVDASPCGGTHPARTGEVGAIAVLGAQKWGSGKARVEFACGGRVVKLLAEQARWLGGAADALKCAARDLPEAARRAADEAVARRKSAEALEKELARLQAAELAAKGSPVVARVERATLARAVAAAVAERGAVALIAAVEDGRAHLCFARPRGAAGPGMNEVLKGALEVLGGKGGEIRFVVRKRPMLIRHDWALSEVRALHDLPLLELVHRAQAVHREAFGDNKVQLCSLLSIKTGGCPEDCAYCPQAARYHTGVEAEPLMETSDVLASARSAREAGATRFCMGAAWREVKDGPQFDRVLEMVRGVRALGLEACCTLGMLTSEQARRLKEAGCTAYNHNLDTSRAAYSSIITTREYDDRLRTLRNVREAGITICSGGIIGMGESVDDRCEMLRTLAAQDPHPESVPINMLVRVAGTPLAERPPVSTLEMVRMIATARLLMPRAMVRLSAGRLQMNAEAQLLCMMAGANSIFFGEKLLTTGNPELAQDMALLAAAGIEPLAPEA